MLVPHFSQVWYLLTPPTDWAGLGTLGDSFPGNRRAASGDGHRHIQRDPLIRMFWRTHVFLSIASTLLFVFTALCQQGLFGFPHQSSAHHPHASSNAASKHWSLSRHEGMLSLSGFILTSIYQSKGGRGRRWCRDRIFTIMNCTPEGCSLHLAQVTTIWKSITHTPLFCMRHFWQRKFQDGDAAEDVN